MSTPNEAVYFWMVTSYKRDRAQGRGASCCFLQAKLHASGRVIPSLHGLSGFGDDRFR